MHSLVHSLATSRTIKSTFWCLPMNCLCGMVIFFARAIRCQNSASESFAGIDTSGSFTCIYRYQKYFRIFGVISILPPALCMSAYSQSDIKRIELSDVMALIERLSRPVTINKEPLLVRLRFSHRLSKNALRSKFRVNSSSSSTRMSERICLANFCRIVIYGKKNYYLCSMETIYDHNPIQSELKELGLDFRSKEEYLKILDQDSMWFKLALLFRLRKDKQNEIRAWSHIPYQRDEFLRGFDVIDLD